MTEKTAEQIAAEQAEAQRKADEKAAEKARKEAEKAEAKAKREAEAAEKKADREAKKAAEKAAKEQAKLDAKAAREATRMPEQNGIRRPKPETETGKVWALADSISASLGQPTPIANLLTQGQAAGLSDSTIRTQYARWRAFHGITGRVTIPTPAAPAAPAEPAAQ